MREIRTSGLMRGKEVGGHCLCALIPWLPSLLYLSMILANLLCFSRSSANFVNFFKKNASPLLLSKMSEKPRAPTVDKMEENEH